MGEFDPGWFAQEGGERPGMIMGSDDVATPTGVGPLAQDPMAMMAEEAQREFAASAAMSGLQKDQGWKNLQFIEAQMDQLENAPIDGSMKPGSNPLTRWGRRVSRAMRPESEKRFVQQQALMRQRMLIDLQAKKMEQIESLAEKYPEFDAYRKKLGELNAEAMTAEFAAQENARRARLKVDYADRAHYNLTGEHIPKDIQAQMLQEELDVPDHNETMRLKNQYDQDLLGMGADMSGSTDKEFEKFLDVSGRNEYDKQLIRSGRSGARKDPSRTRLTAEDKNLDSLKNNVYQMQSYQSHLEDERKSVELVRNEDGSPKAFERTVKVDPFAERAAQAGSASYGMFDATSMVYGRMPATKEQEEQIARNATMRFIQQWVAGLDAQVQAGMIDQAEADLILKQAIDNVAAFQRQDFQQVVKDEYELWATGGGPRQDPKDSMKDIEDTLGD